DRPKQISIIISNTCATETISFFQFVVLSLQNLPLELQQLPVALGAQAHQLLLLLGRESPALAGALELDDLPQLIHHTVQVHLGTAVLAVLQIQHKGLP
ncbi:Fe/S biogenesis protein nfuA, partial [Dysosmobacter welbionis]